MIGEPKTLTLTVPGSTSNLGSGFDTLGLALQLYLTVQATVRPGALEIHYSGTGAETIPSDASNLVYRSYLQGCRLFNYDPLPVRLEINNEIPLRRGLGSSGAAIVAGLLLARELAPPGRSLSGADLIQAGMPLEGHPENISASLLGGLTVNCTHHSRVYTLKVPFPHDLAAVALIPDFDISTEAARELLPAQIPLADAVHNLQRVALWVAALQQQAYELLRFAARDAIHQPFRKKLIPGFDEIMEAAYSAGARAAFLSGSGSTILALVETEKAGMVQQQMEQAAGAHAFSFTSQLINIDTQGARTHWTPK